MTPQLTRRQFVLGAGASVGLLAGCGRLPWQAGSQAQQAVKVHRMGVVVAGTAEVVSPLLDALRQDLRALGYVEGHNFVIEARYGDGVAEQVPRLAAQLVDLQVDVIVAQGSTGALATREASPTIPIVFVEVGAPVEVGIVASLARPGGNATGLAGFAPDLAAKRLELLKLAVPGISRVGVIRVPSPANEFEWQATQQAAHALGLELQLLGLSTANDWEHTLAAVTRETLDALLVLSSPGIGRYRTQIMEFAARRQLPTMTWQREFVTAGGLMTYGPSTTHMWRRAAYYVDRILKGAKPADLPVEQPMTFEFVVNLNTARELSITFPNEILLQVTEVIQ
jgi:putative ABC transport system substrate-binding protein